MGGIVQCHAAEKEEATRDGAVGKEKNLGGRKRIQIGGWGSGFQFLAPL